MKRSKAVYRILSLALMTAGICWVLYLLSDTLTNPILLLPTSWPWFGVASLLVILATAANGLLFYLFLRIEGKKSYPLFLTLKMHYSAQLLRYLPGRLWGIAYQIGVTKEHIPALRIARANLDWMIFSLVGSSLVAILLIGYKQDWSFFLLTISALLGSVCIALIFLGGSNSIFNILVSIFPGKIQHTLRGFNETRISPNQLVLIGGIFILSWTLYLSGWILLWKVFPIFQDVDLITLCAYYTLASVLGIVSAITPAGLGVRESTFIILATGNWETEVIGFFAIFGRIWLMVLEISILLIFFCIYALMNRFYDKNASKL